MMKNLKLWQKAGLFTLVGLPLALGLGFNYNKNSKGLESKIPSIGISTAQAKTTNPQGYEIPDLTEVNPYDKGYLKKAPNVLMEAFYTSDGGRVGRFSIKGKIFGYLIDHDRIDPGNYYLVDNDGDGKFETRYERNEMWDIPNWVKS